MNEGLCRKLVAERSGGLCEARLDGGNSWQCLGVGQSFHHRKKRSQGGLWVPSNILHLCGDGTVGCHGYIEANPAMGRRWHLWLYAGQDSLTTPARLCWRGKKDWYSLDDEGGITWLTKDQLARLKPVG